MKNNSIVILFLIFTSCAPALHQNISFETLMASRSFAAKSLENNADSINCNLNSEIKKDQFIVKNNLWGKSRLKGARASLCSFYSDKAVGWKWNLPENARGVIGYPAVQWGQGPWETTQSLHGFPVRLDSLTVLNVQFAAEQYIKHKKYNLAFDLWLSSAYFSHPKTITTEIMVWEDFYDFRSFGKKIQEIKTPFGDYEFWSGYIKNEEFGQDWQYFAFIRKEKRNAGTVDLNYFLQFLIQKKLIDATQYLTSVELGNEIGNSSGFTRLHNLELHIEKSTNTLNK
ncbi:MAG: hypothetical protein Q4G27_00800 [Flavobacteriaceae bacterium]|nr:hypothetical protein [Flavobacteriaceae bacterium]